MTKLTSTQTTAIRDLISFDTTSVNSNLELITHVANSLEGSGASITLDHNNDGTKANLLATIGPRTSPGGIILSGHTDTVPVTGQNWGTNPYQISETNGKLYARGSTDMKVFCALALTEFDDIARNRATDLQRSLHLVLTYDEEVGCFGAKNLVRTYGDTLEKPDLVLVGEPTSLRAAVAHKGIRCFNVAVKGCGGHSSNPANGVSAIEHSLDFLQVVRTLAKEFEDVGLKDARFEPSHSSVNLATIEGGSAINVIPDECRFSFETRPIPGHDSQDLVDAVHRAFRQASDKTNGRLSVDIEEYVSTLPFAGDEHHTGTQFLLRQLSNKQTIVAPFCTEASAFQENGWNTVVCGPGDIAQAHQPNEFITVEQAQQGAQLIRNVSQRCFQVK